jgi:signal transduction histidine kinase/CheY-like chemotaxis protein
MKLLSLLSRVIRAGVLDGMDKELKLSVINVNYISLVTSVLAFVIGFFLFSIEKSPQVGIPAMLESGLFGIVIWINRNKHYKTAGLIMFFTQCVAAGYFGCLFTNHYTVINLHIVALILFIPLVFRTTGMQIVCLVFAISTIVFLHLSDFYKMSELTVRTVRLNNQRNFFAEFLPLAGIVILVFLVIKHYLDSKDENSELAELNAQLKAANRNLEVANQHKRRFLGGTVHDIRTFQNAISGNTQLLLRDAALDEGLLPHLSTIRDIYAACNGVSDEINDVLDIESIEAGKAEIVRKEAFRLSTFIQSILSVVRISALQKKIKMKLITGDDCPNLLKEDPLKLRKIIINLLSNAIKFADFESEVFLKITRKDDSILFEVVNQGVVIKADQIQAIFNPFVSSAGGYVEGTGLGLYLVKYKVELLGGTIEVRSNQYETSFLVTLPLCEATSTELQAVEKQIQKDLSSYTVLVIEDNEMNGKLMENFLRGWQCNVRWVKDGYMGLMVAKDEQPDIIILDVELPGISGKEVLKALKEDPVLKKIPVIIASGKSGQQEELLAEGADSFILKPIIYSTVKSEMSRLIREIKNITS